MNVYFDNIIFKISRSGGIPTVWANLIERVCKSSNFTCHFLEYVDGNKHWARRNLNLSNVETRKWPSNFIRYINPRIVQNSPFIFHSSYYRVCNNPNAINITTVHDFTYEYFSKGLPLKVHSWQKNQAIIKSDLIACISENTRNDLLKFLPNVNPNKVRVIYNGVSEAYHPLASSKYKELGKFVLFVSGRQTYKRFDLVVETLKHSHLKIVIVGSPLTKVETLLLNSSIGPDRYIVFSGISSADFNELYNAAHCLLYPSMYEGFGIPIIEAQRAGCPVIAYNASSIPEVIGNSPLLVNNLSVDSILECLHLLENQNERETIVQQGFLNANQFSWNKMASDYMALYEEAFNNRL